MLDARKQLAWSKLKVGLVVTTALLVLFLAVLFAGSIESIFAPKVKIHARIGDVNGLRTGAPVWLFGIEVGSVSGIRLDRGHETIVTLSVGRKYLDFIRKDAQASVLTMGLLGDKYVALSTGSPEAPPLGPGDVIEGAVERGITAAGGESLEKITQFLGRLDRIAARIEKGEGTIPKLINDPSLFDNLKDAAETLAQVAQEMKEEQGSFRLLMKNPALYENLNKGSGELTAALEKLNRADGIAGKLVADKDLAEDVKETVKELKGLIKDIKENPKRYFKVSVF
jgi:phospholipid/cholesterol/gamma-HCH transport system substrate-binding protein